MDRSEESGWSRQDRQDQEDYNRDNGIANYWYNRGKEEERAKIVAWLRGFRWFSTASAIEAGKHLK